MLCTSTLYYDRLDATRLLFGRYSRNCRPHQNLGPKKTKCFQKNAGPLLTVGWRPARTIFINSIHFFFLWWVSRGWLENRRCLGWSTPGWPRVCTTWRRCCRRRGSTTRLTGFKREHRLHMVQYSSMILIVPCTSVPSRFGVLALCACCRVDIAAETRR